MERLPYEEQLLSVIRQVHPQGAKKAEWEDDRIKIKVYMVGDVTRVDIKQK